MQERLAQHRIGSIGRLFRPEWLPNGEQFVVGGELNPRVVDASTGEVVFALPGLGEGTGSWDYDMVPGTSRIAVAALSSTNLTRVGDTVIFDLSANGDAGIAAWNSPVDTWRAEFTPDGDRVVVVASPDSGEPSSRGFITAGSVDGGQMRRVDGGAADWWADPNPIGAYLPFPAADGRWYIYDTATGEPIYQAPEGREIHGVSRTAPAPSSMARSSTHRSPSTARPTSFPRRTEP